MSARKSDRWDIEDEAGGFDYTVRFGVLKAVAKGGSIVTVIVIGGLMISIWRLA